MIKKLLTICLISIFTLPAAIAAESDRFTPIGNPPETSLEKESSTQDRPLPALSFYEITPTPTDDPNTFSIESGLFYDDTPINEVYLDKNVKRPTLILPSNMFNSPISVNQASNAITGRSVFNQNAYIREASRSVASIKGSAVEQSGKFSFGAGYSRGLDKAQMEDSTNLFTTYDAGRFAIKSQYLTTSKQNLGTYSNCFKLSPEVKLTDQFRIRSGFTSYTNIPLKKGEVVLVYTPSLIKRLEALNFELGVAQRYNTQTGVTGSEIKFSTGFRL